MPGWLLPDPKKQGDIILETLHDISLKINPSVDNGVELCLFETGSYEHGILDFIKTHYRPEGSFVDVGANIGLMSLFVARHFPKAVVHAFEAHPETAAILNENMRLNDLERIRLHQFALGSEEGEAEIFDNWQVNRGGASLVVKEKGAKGHLVQVKRLDDFEVGSPAMIKIDVEGVELDVLKGAAETIRRHRPILIVEVSDERVNAHESPAEIMDFIRSLGDYRICILKGGKERKSALVEITSHAELPQHDNILCLPR